MAPLMSFAMHPEQNANHLVLRFLGSLDRAALKEIPDDAIRTLRNSIREALRTAVEREREACAAVIEQQSNLQRAAAAIRARSNRAPLQSPTGSGSSVR